MCWFQQSPTSSRPGFPVENRARVHSPVIPVLGTGIHEFGLVYPLNPPEFRCSATVYIEKVVDARAEHERECDREDAWSAGCKSPSHGVTPCVAEGNCVAESEVESNRKRTDSPQENKPDSAAWRGEPAHAWRSLEPTERADVTGKATFGPMTWLGVGCPEGKAS